MGSNKCRESLASKMKNKYKTHLSFLTPDFVATHAVPMFFFTIVVTWIIGVIDVLPNIYKDRGPQTILLQRLFVSFLFTEMMLNWLCIRYVDSSYKQYMDTQGDKHKLEIDNENKNQDARENDKKRKRKDQSSDTSGLRFRFTKPSTMDFSETTITNQKGERIVKYPYWSWSPCFKCDVMRPPRCHHCPLCNTCVLKRDHHCYFTGSCVGWRNQRNFIVFCFWATLACSYALVHALYYIYTFLWSSLSYLDLIPPVTVLRCLLGFVSPVIVIYMSVTMFLFYFVYISANFFADQIFLFQCGLTSFERVSLNRKVVEIKDSRSLPEKIRATLGSNWALSIFVPLHMIFPPEEDTFNWPTVTVIRSSN